MQNKKRKDKFSPQELQAEEWLKKAADDKLFAASILKHRDAPPSGACFHAQQAAEKLLKAFLVFYKKWYPRIHEVDALWELCREIDGSFDDIKDDVLFLTEFYTEARYPGDYQEHSWEEAEKSFAAALHIEEFILNKIHEKR